MRKNLMLIVNPYSGKGQAKSALYGIMSLFCERGYTVTVYISNNKDDPEHFAKEHGEKYDLIVCVGGDGTFSDVTNGLMQLKEPPPIGYIPMGTANDIATSLKISKKPRLATLAIVNGQPTTIDIGSFGKRYFSYIAAFGAFTEVSYSTPQDAKRSLGHFAYVLEGLTHLGHITPQHTIVEYDGGVIDSDFVFGGVTNSTSVAGLVKLDSSVVSFNDGLFEVMLVKTPLKLAEFNSIISDILTRNYKSDNVIFVHTKKVKFTFDNEVAWTLDGENGGLHREIEVYNHHEALKIIL